MVAAIALTMLLCSSCVVSRNRAFPTIVMPWSKAWKLEKEYRRSEKEFDRTNHVNLGTPGDTSGNFRSTPGGGTRPTSGNFQSLRVPWPPPHWTPTNPPMPLARTNIPLTWDWPPACSAFCGVFDSTNASGPWRRVVLLGYPTNTWTAVNRGEPKRFFMVDWQ